jgi:abortive infection bacteriophage resistance protein
MRFSKPALSITDQIALLQRRGMVVSHQDQATHYLKHISYYRLRAYWLPFETHAENGDHSFKGGTNFNDVLKLYVFDRHLRLIVLDAIERIEVSLKALWAYHLAMTYGAHGYLDASLYYEGDYAKALDNLIKELARSRDTFILHYRRKYSEPALPPIWMASEVMSLGQFSKWFGNLKFRRDRKAIADEYCLNEKVLVSITHHLSYVRNICAHHGRLWNKRLTVKMMLPKSPTVLSIALNQSAGDKVYNTLVVLNYVLGIVAPGSDWPTRIVSLMDTCPLADATAMGFPKNWRTMQPWVAD